MTPAEIRATVSRYVTRDGRVELDRCEHLAHRNNLHRRYDAWEKHNPGQVVMALQNTLIGKHSRGGVVWLGVM